MQGKKHKTLVHYLPVYGCISTGLIYAAIGLIAILSFLRIKDGGADESRLLAFLSQYTAGKILIIIILSGTVCYIIWRFYETVTDPYGYGREFNGIAKRLGIALSTVADILIVYAAVRYLFEMGNIQENEQLSEQRQTVQGILSQSRGHLLIISIGVIILFTSLVQLFYGVTRGYRERLEVEEFNPIMKTLVHFMGLTGYFSRAVIIGIIGFFYIKAGIMKDAQFVVDTDKAFDFIGDHVGHVYFIVIAIGTIFYGLFMFALGAGYDREKD